MVKAKSFGLSEWFQIAREHTLLSSSRAHVLIQNELKKYQRLEKLNQEIGLPIERLTYFNSIDFLQNSKNVQSFFHNASSKKFFIKVNPLLEFQKTLFIQRKHDISEKECKALVQGLQPNSLCYEISIREYEEPKWCGIFSINRDEIRMELTQENLMFLTQGLNHSQSGLFECCYNFKTQRWLSPTIESQKIAEKVVEQVRLRSHNSKKSFEYAQGYFEFLYYGKNKFAFLDYNPFWKLPKTIQQSSVHKSNFLIRGLPACSGQITGTVRIVLSPKDFSKIKKGDILVTTMTTPEFIPVFKKIAGIVTDTGGILCHAAIVSRELKIPCIVGTGKATQILKDGQKIELNATKGTVKIV
ncbi:MAG: PEP-utilizing enzyme [Candidatus Diapherotrites archaeon]|nr:PEP-utilizing enzyme [Candidatus Diapherotrites archaeon]